MLAVPTVGLNKTVKAQTVPIDVGPGLGETDINGDLHQGLGRKGAMNL